MADTKTNPTPLDPSPKRIEGEEIGVVNTTVNGEVYGTLHKPALTITKEDKGQETPVIVNEPSHAKEFVKFDKILVNEIKAKTYIGLPEDKDTKGFDVLELTGLSGTLSNANFELAKSEHCVIKVSTQYYYKEFDAQDSLSYKAFPRQGTNKVIVDYVEITKATKGYVVSHFDIVDTNTDVVAELIATLDDTKSYNLQVINGVLTATEIVGE